MDLTPDLLLEAKFAPARRGYDMNEVDDFLERCAEGLDVLLARLRAEFERAERAEEAVAELRAQGGTVAPAQAAAPVSETAPAESAPVVASEPTPVAVEEPMRILIAAERTAEAAVTEARAEAERIRSEAESVASTKRSEAEALLHRSRTEAEAEARKAGEDVRRTIEAEVLALRQDRDLLSNDVRSLRRWLDDQRGRLRSAARDLQRLVDDPAALADLAVPELSELSDGSPEPDAAPVDHDAADAAASAADDGPERASDPADGDVAVAGGDGEQSHGADADEVVDARTRADVQGRFDADIFDDHGDGGPPTQAVPAVETVGRMAGASPVFDDERAPTSGFVNGDGRGAIR